MQRLSEAVLLVINNGGDQTWCFEGGLGGLPLQQANSLLLIGHLAIKKEYNFFLDAQSTKEFSKFGREV